MRMFILDVSIFYLIIIVITLSSKIMPLDIPNYEAIFAIVLLFIGIVFFVSSLSALDSILNGKLKSEFECNTHEYKTLKTKLKSILSEDKFAENEHELNSVSIALNICSNERSWLLSLNASVWDITTIVKYTISLLISLTAIIIDLMKIWSTTK